jgi:N-acetylmuramoyl-L-alanine amidase
MIRSRFRKAILLTLIAYSFCYAQTDVIDTSITFIPAEGDTVCLNGIDSADVLYLSIDDFLKPLQIPGVVNDSTGKIECLFGPQLIRFTDQNPFIVFTDRKSNTASVYQIPTNVIRNRGKFYISLSFFIPLYVQLTGRQLSFDDRQMVLKLGPPSTPKNDIAGIQIEEKLNGTLITVLANRKLGDVESWIKSPDNWLIVTIMGAKGNTAELDTTPTSGAVKKLFSIQSPTSLQLTFQVSSNVVLAETTTDPVSNNLLISLRKRSELEKKELMKKQEAAKEELAHKRDRWKLDVIVIDAGHGGRDPGTIGVTGTREKDITLDVAMKLGRLIERHLKDVNVIYTRRTNKFVELYRRTQIANEAGGKLFISIHCNAMPHKPSRANGFEIYLLRQNLTEEAVAIASRENAVVQFEEGYQERYRKLTEEEFIIITMAQSAYMKYSEQFAESAARSMAYNLDIKNGGVRQAGFYVLVGASMPNVLVELGYLSNRKEEKYLRSGEGQYQIAEALFKGVKEYKLKYEKALREGMEDDSE